MATLVHQCPHPGCLTEKISFSLIGQCHAPGQNPNQFRNFIYLQCPACGLPSVAEVGDGMGTWLVDVASYPLNLSHMGWDVIGIWPEPPKPKLPDHLPDQVAKAFLAAERNFPHEKMEEASAASYGRSLDVGTKLYAPELANLPLFGRIKKLAEQHRITQDLADWAHAIRKIRNDALHDVDEVTRDELIAIRGFTETVLTYLFTMPGMLKARQAGTTEKPGA